MEKLLVTRQFEFCYSHNLPHHLGKCKRVHGHNAVLEIAVLGPVRRDGSAEDGMVIDFGRLDEWVGGVVERLDHRHLNAFLKNPTAENIVFWIKGELFFGDGLSDEAINFFTLYLQSIKLYETRKSWVQWDRDERNYEDYEEDVGTFGDYRLRAKYGAKEG